MDQADRMIHDLLMNGIRHKICSTEEFFGLMKKAAFYRKDIHTGYINNICFKVKVAPEEKWPDYNKKIIESIFEDLGFKIKNESDLKEIIKKLDI